MPLSREVVVVVEVECRVLCVLLRSAIQICGGANYSPKHESTGMGGFTSALPKRPPYRLAEDPERSP